MRDTPTALLRYLPLIVFTAASAAQEPVIPWQASVTSVSRPDETRYFTCSKPPAKSEGQAWLALDVVVSSPGGNKPSLSKQVGVADTAGTRYPLLAVAYAPKAGHSRVYCFLEGERLPSAQPARGAGKGKVSPDPNYKPAGVWTTLYRMDETKKTMVPSATAFFEGRETRKTLLVHSRNETTGEGTLEVDKPSLSLVLLFRVPVEVRPLQLMYGESPVAAIPTP
jgi:hypothetical protein